MIRTCSVLVLSLFPPLALAQYEVQGVSGIRGVAPSLTLGLGAREPIRFAPRGAAWGLQPQISDVQCAGEPLPRDASGYWIAPAGCAKVMWRVRPDRLSPQGAAANEQRTLAMTRAGGKGSWILLSEPTSLLRPADFDGASRIAGTPGTHGLVGATPLAPNYFRVPPLTSGPEFYVVGPAAVTRQEVGQFQVSYIADQPERVRRLGLQALHAGALSYLSGAISLPPAAMSQRSLLVVWIGIAESKAQAGGAAGSRSFVANYVIGLPSGEKKNAALTTAIIAHEQFHQMVDMARDGMPPLPVWLGESLAQYYGLKALLSADDSETSRTLQAKFVDPERGVRDGLLELDRRHATGDSSAHHLFYSQGATFWQALEAALMTATVGQDSLDRYVDELVRSSLPEDGSLPLNFVTQLRRLAGPRIDELVLKYVGR